jgi:hypothetical protein
MADITKCKGEHCPAKDDCLRYKIKANPYWQAYMSVVPWDYQRSCCDFLWERTWVEENGDA